MSAKRIVTIRKLKAQLREVSTIREWCHSSKAAGPQRYQVAARLGQVESGLRFAIRELSRGEDE